MRQLLLLILVFFASQWVFRKLRRASERAQHAGGPQAGAGRGPAPGANSTRSGRSANSAPQLLDPLVRCAECGVHTPTSESIVAAGHRFCSADHARRHAARPTGRDAR